MIESEKKYVVVADGKTYRFNEQDWSNNMDEFMKDFPQAEIAEVESYKVDDYEDNDNIVVRAGEKDYTFSGKDWKANESEFMKDFPDAKIARVRGVDYYYNQANKLDEELKAKDEEIKAWQDSRTDRTGMDWSSVMMQQSGLSPIGAGFDTERDAALATYAAEGTRLQQERDELQSRFDSNPRVIEAKERAAQMQKEYDDNLLKEINATLTSYDNDKDVVETKMREIDARMSALDGQYGAILPQIGPSKETAEKVRQFDKMGAAKEMLEHAKDIREGKTEGFWQGGAHFFEKEIEGIMYQTESDTMVQIAMILKNLNDKVGNLNENLTPEVIDKNLSKDDALLLRSYFSLMSAQKEVGTGWKYKAGEIAAAAIPFALEFAALGGFADDVAKGATKGLQLGLERWVAEGIEQGGKALGRKVLKYGAELGTKGLIKAAMMTAMRPSTYSTIAQHLPTIDEEGNVKLGKNATIGALDSFIETISELSGGVIEDILGLGMKWGKGVTSKIFGESVKNIKFPAWAKVFTNGAFGDYLKQAGFHGLPTEIMEEYIGNAMRLTYDKNALKEMHEDGNGAAMWLGFVPMTLFGGAMSAGTFRAADQRAAEIGGKLNSLLVEKGFTEKRANALTERRTDKSPLELHIQMNELREELKKKGATQEELDMVDAYAIAVAQFQTMRGVTEMKEKQDLDEVRNELTNQYGTYAHNGNVTTAKTTDGRSVFIVSEKSATGEYAAVDMQTGQHITISDADIATQNNAQGQPVQALSSKPESQYIGDRLLERNRLKEAERMLQERNEQIAKIRELMPEQLNLGTEGEPNMVVVKSQDANGVTVVDANGNEAQMSWDAVGRVLGLPIHVFTDMELAEMEAQEIALKREALKAERAKTYAENNNVSEELEQIKEKLNDVTPKPEVEYTNEETGEVDEVSFWENDPEGFCEWNDRQNKDGGADSIEQLENAMESLSSQLDAATKASKTDNPISRKAAKREVQRLSERIQRLQAIQDKYLQKFVDQVMSEVESAEQRAETVIALRERINEWRERFNLDESKLVVYESLDEVEREDWKRQIMAGETPGWQSGKKAYIYLPHVKDMSMLDKTVMHEVVTHFGLRTLLGEKDYNALMDKVWNMMSDSARRTMSFYPGVQNKEGDERRRAAAEEFVAMVGEYVVMDTASAEQKSIWKRISDSIAEKFDNMQTRLNGVDVAGIVKDNYTRLEAEGAEMQTEETAAENATANAEEILVENGYDVDEQNGDVRFSSRYITNDAQREDIISSIVDVTGRSAEDAERWLQSEESVASLVLADKQYLDYLPDDKYKAIKDNSDYPQGTVDFNNICRKRIPFTKMYTRLQRRYPNRIFTAEELADIRTIMSEDGLTVACGLCYVEDRRQKLGEVADAFISDLKDGFRTYGQANPTKQANAAKFLVMVGSDAYIPTIYDLITLEGSDKLYNEHKGIWDAFGAYNRARGQQTQNTFQGYAEYKREILGWSKAKVSKVNSLGGLRVFSYSDFEAHHLLDLVQIIIDCAAKGVMIQGYTKVPEFARAVANTNIKLNRSLIPLGDTGIVDGQLAFDPVEGIDINDLNFLESNDNVGNILIGINSEQIRLAMADPRIHYIIPYHARQAGVIRNKLNVGAWSNYIDTQNERDARTGKRVAENINIYTDILGADVTNDREFVEKYLQKCKEMGRIPKFDEFLDKDAEGNYVYTPGYYKFLVDFKLFDENGNILPQKPVVAQFDDAFNMQILQDYAEGERQTTGEQMNATYDKIVETLGLNEAEAEGEDIRFKTDVRGNRNNSISLPLVSNAIKTGVWDNDAINELNKTIDDVTKGLSVLNRFTPQEQRGLLGASRLLVGASIIARGSEADDFKSKAQRKTLEERANETIPAITEWAKAVGVWREYSDRDKEEITRSYVKSGGEAEVFVLNNGMVEKIIGLDYYIDPQLALDRIVIHNYLFPETALNVVGFGTNKRGEFAIIVEQPIISGDFAPQDEIDSYIEGQGFKKIDDISHTFVNEDLYLSDLHQENVLTDDSERYYIIDGDFRLNTPEAMAGGNRQIDDSISNTFFKTSNRNQAIFVSNAARAVEGIQMGKATPEQWLKMIEKSGGLKAGEDKWMGLSDWLKASDKKTLTKDEVMQFINDNMIVIEEQHYSENGMTEDEMFEEYIQSPEGMEHVNYQFSIDAAEFAREQLENRELSDDEYEEELSRLESEYYEDDLYGTNYDIAKATVREEWEEQGKRGVREGERMINDTRLDYTTEGLDNNHEIALVVPTIEPYEGSLPDVHFFDAGEGRAVAWIRFGETSMYDRKDNVYKHVLVIDEIQSQRHQDGREKGYRVANVDKWLKSNNVEVVENGEFFEFYKNGELDRRFSKGLMKYNVNKAKNLYVSGYEKSNIPEAPFEKNWHELAMKRMLRYAAENGYDAVAWTKGDQQNERYGLGGYVDSIQMIEEHDGMIDYLFYVKGYEESSIIGVEKESGIVTLAEEPLSQAEGKPLSDLVGKEMAIRMLQMEQDESLRDTDLQIGGEGMRGFYDHILPKFMDKYGKKWGIKTEDMYFSGLEGGLTMHSVPVTEEMKESVMEGQTMFKTRMPNQSVANFLSEVVPEFESKYNIVAPATIMKLPTMSALAKALKLDVSEISDKMYEDFIAKWKRAYATYAPVINEDESFRHNIIIFAHNEFTTSFFADTALFHENIHGFVMENEDLLKLGTWLYENANQENGIAFVKPDVDKYPESERHEEMLTHYVSAVMALGFSQKALDIVSEEYKPLLNYIYERFGYNPETEDGERRRRYVSERNEVDGRTWTDRPSVQVAKGERKAGSGATFFKTAITPEVRKEMDAISAQAIVNGNYLKAPNGKDTKLTPEQWALVRTKNFKRWFGDWELAARLIDVVSGTIEHGFANFDEAKEWAKSNIVRTYSNEETGQKGTIEISNNAVKKYLSKSAVEKSDSKDLHLAVLKYLPEIIRTGVIAETHADHVKNENGERTPDSPINLDVKIHRVYGAVEMGGKVYRVKVTIKEHKDDNRANTPHSYEATKIELLAGTLVGADSSNPNTNNSITGAKLLENVDKSYEKGKILDYSKVVDANGEPMVVYHGTAGVINKFEDQQRSPGFWFTDREDVANGYAESAAEEFGEEKNIIPVFLNIRNPRVEDAYEEFPVEFTLKAYVENDHGVYEVFDTYEEAEAYRVANVPDGWVGAHEIGEPHDLVERARELGNDGVIMLNIYDQAAYAKTEVQGTQTNYVVFDADQIKSATENNGEYSESEDIRFKTEIREEAKLLLQKMQENAELLVPRQLTKEVWDNEIEGKVFDTPVGKVKFGPNQYDKNLNKGRAKEFGMLLPTILRPDLIYEEYYPEDGAERQTKYVFVKTFYDENGEKHINYASVTVLKEGLEVVESSHRLRNNQMLNKIEKEHLLWNRFASDSTSSAPGSSTDQNNALDKDTNKSDTNNSLEGETFFKTDPSTMSVDELVEQGKQKVIAENKDAIDVLMDRIRAINGNLQQLRMAAAAQRQYDKRTVDAIVKQANELLEAGKLADLTRGEIKRILSVVNNANGKADLTKEVGRLMDIMIANQLRMGRENIDKFLRIRGKKVDARGVEVRGRLDIKGQQIMDAVRENIGTDLLDILMRMVDVEEKLTSESETIRRNAENELIGLRFARQYVENIKDSEKEEKKLRQEKKDAEQEYKDGVRDRKTYIDFVDAVNEAIRENRIQRVLAYQTLAEDFAKLVTQSINNAGLLRDAEKERVQKIQRFANSDMQGLPSNEHGEVDSMWWNNPLVRFLLKPLATFDQMLRHFGRKSVNGEGYLWNHFMRGWLKSTETEYKAVLAAHETLDAKARELFRKEGIKKWSDIFEIDRKLPTSILSWWDGGEMKDHEVTQGNLLYIYMVNKMVDGKMKLRKMGITEEDVDKIKNSIDPRFVEIADWIQDEFLPSLRDKYNALHEKLFGAPMAAIDNYFPIRVLANAREREVDLGVEESNAKPSTITGSIIKRTRNSLALDILGSNAFDVVLEHIQQMEHWAAFAEFNQDLNTLLSYKKFRNRVQNMSGIYGSGNTVWSNFRSVAELAAGVYQPASKSDSIDKTALNLAKGVTAAKISFRVYTAIKQLLSMPAFVSDARADILLKNIATPWEAWKWAMGNLPLFEKRWKSRQAGDTRLMQTDSDWKIWKNKVVDIASRYGMSPNAFVDALTVAIGARSIYESKLKAYVDMGYSEAEASERAMQDATILFNESQQSNESAFLSTMQVDRTAASVAFSLFRNSSMGYQRMFVDAVRNIGHKFTKGYKEESIEFMKKQLIRDGVAEDQAERAAKRIYARSMMHSAARAVTFGFLVQFAWNLGAYLPYLIAGDDDDEKRDMVKDAARHALFGPMEGLSGGSILSELGNMIVSGEELNNYDPTLLPVVSDMKKLINMFSYDEVSAANEMFNILLQAGIGVNPQTLTDAVVAIVDACNGDLETAKEATLCLLRILQIPQTQADKIYIDEIDFTADKGLELTIYEFAKRYADYKVNRGAPLTGWMYSDEKEKEREDKYIKRFNKMAEEYKRSRGNEEAKKYYEYLDNEYKEVTETIGELKRKSQAEGMKSNMVGAMEYAEMLDEFMKSDAFKRYATFGGTAGAIEKIRDKLLKVDVQTMGELEDIMLELRKEMVEEMEKANL